MESATCGKNRLRLETMTTTPSDARPARRLDPWPWVAAAAALLPLLKAWGAPLGEPVADDYDFLHRAILEPTRSLFDGGGALIYWRPLSRQIYFAATGNLMLAHPWAVAVLHVVLLAASAVLIQRALAPSWGGARAAVAATFPVIADSARTLIQWPAAFQDLGALFFISLAFFETTRRRLPTALFAILAALLCKELAAIPALLLPWVPEIAAEPKRKRRRWMISIAAVVAAWGFTYAIVLRSAHLMVQGQLEGARPAFPLRVLWALGSSLADGFNLRGVPNLAIAIAALALAAAIVVATRFGRRGEVARGARSPEVPWTAWLLWGGLWFVLCSATLAETYPGWGSFRSTIGLAGLGVACVAALGSSRSLWLALLAGARIVLLLLAPGPPSTIIEAVPGEGAGFDLATLARLQRVSRETRAALAPGQAPLPPGARVTWLYRPVMTERAFAHSYALQVWYRDTTLRWTPWQEAVDQPDLKLGAGLEYDVNAPQQIIRVSPAALEKVAAALRAMRADDFHLGLPLRARAFSIPRDRAAAVFQGMLAGKRALCLLSLDDRAGAREEAMRGLTMWPKGADARYVLAVLLATEGRLGPAMAQLDTVLAFYPGDLASRILLDTLRTEAAIH
jgi:hypothetical protein